MSWFSRTEDYSVDDNTEPEITYGFSDGTTSGSSSSSAPFDDFQHEREYTYWDNQHTR